MRFKSKGDYYGQTESKIGQEREMQKTPGKYGATRSPLQHGSGVDHGMEKAKSMQPRAAVTSSEERTNFDLSRRFKKVKKMKAIKRAKAYKR